MKGILTSDGRPFKLDNVSPLIGYQVEHKLTGRLLPTCTRFQIYDLFSMLEKMGQVAEFLDREGEEPFDIFEYELVPIYEGELEGSFILIKNNFDIS